MPWSYFVCIIKKCDFFVELPSQFLFITVHTNHDLLLRCASSLEIWRTGDPWFNLPSIKKENLTNKSLQPIMNSHIFSHLSLHWPLLISNVLCVGADASQLQNQVLTYHSFAFVYKSIVLSWKLQYKQCKHAEVVTPAPPSPTPSRAWVSLSLNSAMWLYNLGSNDLDWERPSQVLAQSGLNKSKPFTQTRWA